MRIIRLISPPMESNRLLIRCWREILAKIVWRKSNPTPLPSTTPPTSVNNPDSDPTSNDNATVGGGKNTSGNPSMDYTPDDAPVPSVGGGMNYFDDGAGDYQPQEPAPNDYS